MSLTFKLIEIVKNRVVATFRVDRAAQDDNALADKMEKQIMHIHLRQRFRNLMSMS